MLKNLNRKTTDISAVKTERVLQFGGGNFLRAFVDWMIDVYNEKKNADLGVLLVTPISIDKYSDWQDQDGLYHVLTRGYQNGELVREKHLVACVSRILHLHKRWDEFLASAENPDMRYIVSNTTEAGIRFSPDDKLNDTPPNEFPAKLTLWLYHRYQYFKGSHTKGCILIPVELILENGKALERCILQNAENWGLEESFKSWIKTHNTFCNTLVDRIVPGVRENKEQEWKQLGYKDAMITQGEVFHFWGIEAPEWVQKELPLNEVGLNVVFTNNLKPYRTRKVRILNGAHTSMVPVGFLSGIETVREAVEHEIMGAFVRQLIFAEIIPTLDLPDDELQSFANDVLDRFKNPFIRHELLSISLNSVSKFQTRVLPSIIEYEKRNGNLPERLVLSMAALIHFYRGEQNGKSIPLKDDPAAVIFLRNEWDNCDASQEAFLQMAEHILKWEYAWKQNLTSITGFCEKLANYLYRIEVEGMLAVVATL